MRVASLLAVSVAVAGCAGGSPVRTPPVTSTPDDTAAGPDDTATEPVPDPGPVVRVHPSVATILEVDWTQPADAEAAWVSWTFEGVDAASPRVPVPAGPAHAVVLGLPAGVRVDLTLHQVIDGVEAEVWTGPGTTGVLPAPLVPPVLTDRDPTRARPEPYLLTSVNVGPIDFFGPCWTVILDAAGRIVWYRETPDSRLTWQPRVSRRGGYLVLDASSVYASGAIPTIDRVTLDLAQHEEVVVEGLSTGSDELDDGSFVFGEMVDTVQFHLTVQHPDGSRERLWDCYPWISGWYPDFWGCSPNTVTWDPVRQTVLWSMFETDTVLELTLDGAIVTELGAFPGGLAFDPPQSAFALQHYPNWTSDGHLILSSHDPWDDTRQVAREYALDPVDGVAREVWSLDAEVFADYAGQIQRLPSGNLLWQLGTAGIISELTPAGEVVWRITWADHLTGNATPVADLYGLNTGW
ncbi:MAG: hypothetical protein ABMB14_32425 [Myxococcota bacterium]